MNRTAEVRRETKETQISVRLDVDGTGVSKIVTGIGFYDHMLESFARHGGFDLEVETVGDLHIDMHHTVEDTAIVLGQAFAQALPGFKGVRRFGHAYVPMDETLTRCAVDLSGRPYLIWRVQFARDRIGTFDTELFKEFHHAFAMNAGACVHLETLYGENSHHIAESGFKALARALRTAVEVDPKAGGQAVSTEKVCCNGMGVVALIDYGSGNLRSAEKALVEAARRVGFDAEVQVTRDPEVVRAAERIVLPGVGAFASCRAGLDAAPGLLEAMTEAVRTRGAPFLGVCVGMQLLADRGLEFGETAGLGWVPGEVRRLEPADGLPVPHMGWNAVAPTAPNPLLEGEATMYFANSFAFHPAQPADVVGVSEHGGAFTAMVRRDNVAGVQFHPEKSQDAGLALLARFLEWRP